jgi:hypothetical protein
MKIKILNKRLRANGKRWLVGEVVDVADTFAADAADETRGMFEVVPEPKKAKK